jgi:hypothetical protein
MCGDVYLNSSSSFKVIEVYFVVHEDEEGGGCKGLFLARCRGLIP